MVKGIVNLTKIRDDKTEETPFATSLTLNLSKLMKVKRVRSR